MKKYIKLLYSVIWEVFRYIYTTTISLFRFFRDIKVYVYADSYYPEKNKKSNFKIAIEQISYILKYGYINEQYFVYGFDVKTKQEKETYLDYPKFSKIREKLNQGNFDYSYIALLRDKFIFHQYLKSLNIPTPQILVLLINGKIKYQINKSICSIEDLLNEDIDSFCKKVDGECADGVFKLTIKNRIIYIGGEEVSMETFLSKIQNGIYIIQQKITQHPLIDKINSSSVNTIRLTTILNTHTQEAEFFSATLRVGTKKSFVDNWAVGGLLVNIKDNGTLDKYGYYKPGFGGKVTLHPTSEVIFENYQIPFFKESVQVALDLHNMLYGIHSIGWDIAITENGPMFIEGNDNWELSVTQASLKGMKEEFKQTF